MPAPFGMPDRIVPGTRYLSIWLGSVTRPMNRMVPVSRSRMNHMNG